MVGATLGDAGVNLAIRLDGLPGPLDRLKALTEAWVGRRDIAARYGCPIGTLAVELDRSVVMHGAVGAVDVQGDHAHDAGHDHP